MLRLTPEKKKILLFLIFIATLAQIGVDLYLPSMPHMAIDLQSSLSAIKLTMPLYLIGIGASQLFYGPISDAVGRKPVLIFGLIAFCIGSLGSIFSRDVAFVLAFRLVQGVGAGGTMITLRAALRDVFHGKQMAKVSAIISAFWGITPIAAPVIGGYIQSSFGWQVNFLLMALYGGGILFFSCLLLPETLDNEHKKTFHVGAVLRTYVSTFSDKVFLSFSIVSSLGFGYFVSFATISPFLLQTELGLTPIQYGWGILFIASGAILGYVTCSKIVLYLKIIQVLLIGASLMLVSSLVMLLLAKLGKFNVAAVIVPPFFGSMGVGLVMPSCTVGAMTAHRSNAGVAGALLGFIQMFNSFIFSGIISHLPSTNAGPLSLQLVIVSALAFPLLLFFIRPHFQEETEVK